MIDQNSRPARKVGIADHLWETYEDMAQQMGSDRDALINQALFVFARLHGFIEVKQGRGEAVGPVAPVSASARSAGASRTAPPMLASVSGGSSRHSSREDGAASRPPPRPSEERASASALDNDPARREVAERVLETAAELERLIKGKGEPSREAVDDGLLAGGHGDDGASADGHDPGGAALVLTVDGSEPQRVAKERFVIGRGKHCDLVINSGKVSREHAVILREGSEFFIEDLGSSNGTWFNKQRIKRRKVEDGDEYFICSERVRLTYR